MCIALAAFGCGGKVLIFDAKAFFRTTFRAAILTSFSKDTRCFASMIGSFAFLWKLVNNSLFFYRGRQSKLNGAIAGMLVMEMIE